MRLYGTIIQKTYRRLFLFASEICCVNSCCRIRIYRFLRFILMSSISSGEINLTESHSFPLLKIYKQCNMKNELDLTRYHESVTIRVRVIRGNVSQLQNIDHCVMIVFFLDRNFM